MIDAVVSLWSMIAAACATLALVHLMVWLTNRRSHASLAFVGYAVAIAVMALFELRLMSAQDTETYATLLRWSQFPTVLCVLSIVAFTRATFGPAHTFLALAAVATRLLALLPNAIPGETLQFSEITALHGVHLLGRSVATPIGVTSAWLPLGELATLLLLVYIIAASRTRERLGGEERRRAFRIGGGLALFVAISFVMVTLVNRGLAHLPYMVSVPAVLVTLVMTYELSRDLLRASRLSLDLSESRQYNELAASAAGVGLWSWHVGRSELWANEVARSMHSLGAREACEPDWLLERIHPYDRAAVEVTVRNALNGGAEFETDYRIAAGTDPWRWIEVRGAIERDAAGRPVIVSGVCLDISERRTAEERFRMVVEAAPNAMLAVDAAGRITLANQQAEVLFGAGRYGLLGRSIDELVVGIGTGTHRAYRERFAVAPEARTMGEGREVRARRMDGTEFSVEVGLNPLQSPQGPLVLASIVDITTRLQQQRELMILRDEHASVARMSLAGQLASTLAHELNQPLGAILRNAEAAGLMLKSGNASAEELAEMLEDIQIDDRRAGAIIDHMRSLLRRRQAELGPVRLDNVIGQTQALLRYEATSHEVTFEVQMPHGLSPVLGDAVHLQQVLLNLVFNALRAMNSVPPSTRHLVVRARDLMDDTIELTVRDTGPGIPQELMGKIFEPFYSTSGSGMGMGLAISRALVESMRGRIDAQNLVEGGALFRIVLQKATADLSA